MRTGDIILCSGNGFLSRRIIGYNKKILHMTGTAAELSHVAMIGPTDGDVFEATTVNSWADGGQGKRGVQANPFLSWIHNYDGIVWIREQNHNLTGAMRVRMQSRMCQLIGTPYEHGIPGLLELTLAGIRIPWLSNAVAQKLRTTDAVHCSEADGDVLRYAGVFHSEVRINKIPPCLWWDTLMALDDYYDAPRVLKSGGKFLYSAE